MAYCTRCGAELPASSKYCVMCGLNIASRAVSAPVLVLVGIRPTVLAGYRSLCEVGIINNTDSVLRDIILKGASRLFETDQQISLPKLDPGPYKGHPLAFEIVPQLPGEYRIALSLILPSKSFGIGTYTGEVRVQIQGGLPGAEIHVEVNAERFIGVDMSHMINLGKPEMVIGDVDWRVVELYPVEEDALDIETAFRSKLVIREGGVERTVFMIPKREIVFGMAKRERQPEVDLTLRLLPIRSRSESPDNWRKSAMISKVHGRLKVERNKALIRDESLNGLFLRGVTEDDDRHIDSLDTWMELYGTLDEDQPVHRPLVRLPQNEWVDLPDHIDLCIGKDLLRLRLEVYRPQNRESVSAIRLVRVSNFPQHEYVQMIGPIKVGYGSSSLIQLQDTQLRVETAFEIYVGGDAYYIRSLVDTLVWLDGTCVASGTERALESGSTLQIGCTNLVFTAVDDKDFVTV